MYCFDGSSDDDSDIEVELESGSLPFVEVEIGVGVYMIGDGDRMGEGDADAARDEDEGAIGEGRLESLDCCRGGRSRGVLLALGCGDGILGVEEDGDVEGVTAEVGGVKLLDPFEVVITFFGCGCCFCNLFSTCFPAILPAESGTLVPKPFISDIIASSSKIFCRWSRSFSSLQVADVHGVLGFDGLLELVDSVGVDCAWLVEPDRERDDGDGLPPAALDSSLNRCPIPSPLLLLFSALIGVGDCTLRFGCGCC